MAELNVIPIARIELSFASDPWPFARQRRAEIDAHFAERRRKNPKLWNGQVLMLRDHAISGEVFRGTCFAVDYASFLAWHDWNFPDDSVSDCFAQGALRAADGAFLLGVMAAHTANAGLIYFPSGTPDLDDVIGTSVDLDANMRREIAEETGLDTAELVAASTWHTILDGPRIAHFKMFQAKENAETLRARILAHLARDPQSELADIRIVRGPADLEPSTFPTTAAFVKYVWRRAAASA